VVRPRAIATNIFKWSSLGNPKFDLDAVKNNFAFYAAKATKIIVKAM